MDNDQLLSWQETPQSRPPGACPATIAAGEPPLCTASLRDETPSLRYTATAAWDPRFAPAQGRGQRPARRTGLRN